VVRYGMPWRSGHISAAVRMRHSQDGLQFERSHGILMGSPKGGVAVVVAVAVAAA